MTEAAQALIQIEDLTKVFYTDEVETHALSGVHLAIRKGEYVAMSGPSGCGKSTLLSIIGLLDTPTSGRYQLNSQPVENLGFAAEGEGAAGFAPVADVAVGDRDIFDVMALGGPESADAAGRELAVVGVSAEADDAEFAVIGGSGL